MAVAGRITPSGECAVTLVAPKLELTAAEPVKETVECWSHWRAYCHER